MNNMKTLLNKIHRHHNLEQQEAYDVLINMGRGGYTTLEMAAFLSAFNMKEITLDELTGFRNAMLELSTKVQLDAQDSIDMCGTGGDGKNTFNVSTISALVVAGAGYRVVKHGNYGVSSRCGSSNVMETLGYQFPGNADDLQRQLDKAGICFLHAPLFHPAMKHVAPVRKALGVKTFFNLLGPLVNPAQPSHQLVGVYNLKVARIYQYLLEQSQKTYAVVYNLDGYDEVTLTAPARVLKRDESLELSPDEFGFGQVSSNAIYGGNTVEESGNIFRSVLAGNGTREQNDVVAANAGLAIHCLQPQKSMHDCIREAELSIKSGKARNVLKQLLN